MNFESFPCRLVSWDEAFQLSQRLAHSIKSSRFKPDLVIAIGRGGYVPARIVCDYLLHSLLASIKIEHWDKAACKRPEAAVRFPLPVDIRDQRVLIVDDITDTGDTLKAALDYVSGLGAAEIRTAVMQHKSCSSVVPDYYADVIEDWIWIIYPWAAHEDLVGFAERVLTEEVFGIEQIRARLNGRYGLSVSESDLLAALDDLVEMKRAEALRGGYRKS